MTLAPLSFLAILGSIISLGLTVDDVLFVSESYTYSILVIGVCLNFPGPNSFSFILGLRSINCSMNFPVCNLVGAVSKNELCS